MNGNPYVTQSVETASPAQLVTMLYDGVLAAIARAQVPEQSPVVVNQELQRAQRIITELRVTLDFERGGEIALNLSAIYRWLLDQLLEANLRKDPSALGPVARQVATLREAWVEAAAQQAAAQPARPR